MLKNKLFFGTAGIPHSTPKKSTLDAISQIKRLGLDLMEIEFVRGVRMSEELSKKIREKNKKENIFLSCHCPYYINLASKEDEKIKASRKRIIDSAKALYLCDGKNVVFHAGYYQGRDKEKVLEKIINEIKKVRKELDEMGLENIILRPELTGKASAVGDEFELVRISKEVKNTFPCIDFSHYWTRYQGEKSFKELIELLAKELPELKDDLHGHISGIEFTNKGEKNHLVFEESDFPFKDLLRLLFENDFKGTIVCESPNLEEDAMKMKKYYEGLFI
ncbi:MAG: hypothetical protein C0601_02810 [Candidatus Muiribacterium halophilum]|uniref:Xylose isomerase-like TIM barrel domain-containing protein n=1 Tax=Muiribacterium halophilum TaxID=2053465 RepID=A0A2N5ZK03_MUIH1|nr:MAG: hypothetical protein C0601_02810 [Candidatus Muirbacterium halophilum]